MEPNREATVETFELPLDDLSGSTNVATLESEKIERSFSFLRSFSFKTYREKTKLITMHSVIAITIDRAAQMIATSRQDISDPNNSIIKAPKFIAIGVADNKVPRIAVSLFKIMKYKQHLNKVSLSVQGRAKHFMTRAILTGLFN